MNNRQQSYAEAEGVLDGPYAWSRLAISILLGTIGSVGMWAVVLVLPAVQADFDIDRADASVPFTATMVGFALGNAIIGRYVDRLGIVIPLIGAAIALSSGLILASLAPSIWFFAIPHALLIGMGTAATFGPMIADISHWFRRRLGFAVAAAASGNYLAGAIWPNILQGFLQDDGWRAVYFGVGLFVISTMVPLALLLRRRLPQALSGDQPDIPTAHSRNVIDLSPRTLQIMLVIAGISCCVAMSMPQVHIVAYCADLGFGVARGAEMLSLMLAAGVVSRLLSGFLADYIGGVRTLLIGSVLQGLALLLYMPFDGLASLYIVSMIFGLSQGGIVPSYAIIVREYLPAKEAGERVGLVIMATIVGMAFGGWLSGWIYDITGSYQVAFINGVAWNALNVAIIVMVLWRTKRPAMMAA